MTTLALHLTSPASRVLPALDGLRRAVLGDDQARCRRVLILLAGVVVGAFLWAAITLVLSLAGQDVQRLLIVEVLLSGTLITGVRLLPRVLLELLRTIARRGNAVARPAVLIAGAGEAGRLALHEIESNPRWRYRAVGFLDAGNVFERPSDVGLGNLVGSVGFGVRLATPFALLRADFSRSLLVRTLLTLRGYGSRQQRGGSLKERLHAMGFSLLGENPPSEIAFGVAGQFWKLGGGLCGHFDAAQFIEFQREQERKRRFQTREAWGRILRVFFFEGVRGMVGGKAINHIEIFP